MTGRRRQQQTGWFDLALPRDDAFKLFTAEGERLWVPGWSPDILGRLPQAPGLVFLTGHHAESTIWTVLESDPAAGLVRYSRVTPGSRAGLVEVRVAGDGDRSRVEVTYDLTALSAEGEDALQAHFGPHFTEMLKTWERLIAEFLETDGARERLEALIA